MPSIRVLHGEEAINKRIEAGDVSVLGEIGRDGGFLIPREYRSFKAFEIVRVRIWSKPRIEEVGLSKPLESVLRKIGVLSAEGVDQWLRMASGSSQMHPDRLAEIREKNAAYLSVK